MYGSEREIYEMTFMENAEDNRNMPIPARNSAPQPTEIPFGPAAKRCCLTALMAAVLSGCNLSLDFDAQAGNSSRYSKNPIHDLSISADGGRIAVQHWNGVIEVYDTESEESIAAFDHTKPKIDSIALSADGSLLAIGCVNGEIIVKSLDTNQPDLRWGENSKSGNSIISLAFSGNGRYLVTGGTHPRQAAVRVWEIEQQKVIAEFDDLPGTVMFVKFTENDRNVAYACGNGTLVHRSIAGDWECTITPQERYFLFGAAISDDGRRFAACGENGRLVVYDAHTGKELVQQNHEHSLYSVAFAADNRTVACGDANGSVLRTDVETSRQLDPLRIHLSAIRRVAFHPRQATIFSAGFDGLWQATPVPAEEPSVAAASTVN